MMTQLKLLKLRAQWEAMHRSPQRARDLEELAKKLGRVLVDRGKHPNWESTHFKLNPVSIPNHSKNAGEVSIGVRNSVLAALKHDLDCWERELSNEGRKNNDD